MDQEAVSSVIGTVLILAITVGAFGGIAVVVLDAVDEAQSAPRADIDVQQRGQRFVVLHRGGDAIDATDVQIIVYTNGVATTYSLATSEADGVWSPGEVICIPCIHGDADGVEVILVHGGSQVVAAAGTSAPTGSGGGGGSGAVDLTPTGLQTDTFIAGEPGRFRATVQNLGAEAATTFAVTFAVDGVQVGTPQTVNALAGGGSIQVQSSSWTGSAGFHDLRVTVDSGGAVAEANEANNIADLTFSVATGGAQPDLLPDGITGELFEPGQGGTFGVGVHNLGSTDAGPFTVAFKVDGVQVGTAQTVSGLVAGGSTQLQSAAWTAATGSHIVSVTVDSGGAISESDETNNVLDLAFEVGSPGTQAYQDKDNDLVYDLGADIPLTIGPLTNADCSPASGRPCSTSDDGIIVEDDGTGPGLVIPATSQDFTGSSPIYIEAPGPVTIGVDLTGPSSGGAKDMWLVSVNATLTATGTYRTNGIVSLSSGADMVLDGAHVETSGTRAEIQAVGALHADGAALVADEIVVASGDIHQAGLHLCVTWDSGTGACLQAHVDATKPSDPRATNSNGSTLIGTLAEGMWDL